MREYLKNMPNPLGNCLENTYDKQRQREWKKQRKKYGFDERQTWNLNTTMIELLYERTMMYKEMDVIDLDCHKIVIGSEEKTQLEWINIVIELCENCLAKDINYEKDFEIRLWKIWAEISYHMWW